MSTDELMSVGKYLDAVEKELYSKFLVKLSGDDWNSCGQIVRLLEGLTII